MSTDKERESVQRVLLVNMVFGILLFVGINVVSIKGVKGILEAQWKHAQSRTRRSSVFSKHRQLRGWPYLRLFALLTHLSASLYSVVMINWNVVIPIWMRGYNKSAAANVFCRVNNGLFWLFCSIGYGAGILFWFERLLFVFESATIGISVSVWLKAVVYVGQTIGVVIPSFIVFLMHCFAKGEILESKSLDIDPFKAVNPNPTYCNTVQFVFVRRVIVVVSAVVGTIGNSLVAYAFYKRLRLVFARTVSDGKELSKEQKILRKTTVIAIVSLVSTLFFFVFNAAIPPVDFVIGADVFVNTLCIVCVFDFGDDWYKWCCVCFEKGALRTGKFSKTANTQVTEVQLHSVSPSAVSQSTSGKLSAAAPTIDTDFFPGKKLRSYSLPSTTPVSLSSSS